MDTRLRAAVMVGCRTSFRFAVTSRDGAIVVADSGALPVQQDNTAVYNVNFWIGHKTCCQKIKSVNYIERSPCPGKGQRTNFT